MILLSTDRFAWCDVETFGLDPDNDPLLEVAFAITDLHLEIEAHISIPIWSSVHREHLRSLYDKSDSGDKNAAVVVKMHEKSELFKDAQTIGISPVIAERQIHDWLISEGVYDQKDPLCGSSVAFDRSMLQAQMPLVADLFHYRNIDVSSVKELCARFNPVMFSHLNEDVSAKKEHRALPDILDTLLELGWYMDNFFFVDI